MAIATGNALCLWDGNVPLKQMTSSVKIVEHMAREAILLLHGTSVDSTSTGDANLAF